MGVSSESHASLCNFFFQCRFCSLLFGFSILDSIQLILNFNGCIGIRRIVHQWAQNRSKQMPHGDSLYTIAQDKVYYEGERETKASVLLDSNWYVSVDSPKQQPDACLLPTSSGRRRARVAGFTIQFLEWKSWAQGWDCLRRAWDLAKAARAEDSERGRGHTSFFPLAGQLVL